MARDRVKFTFPRSTKQRILKFYQDILQDESFLDKVGKNWERDTRLEINKGNQPGDNNYPPLSEEWREERDRLINKGVKTAKGYLGSKRSNLTFTGQFINSIKYSLEKSRSALGFTKKFIELYPRGNHRPYQKGGKVISNEELGDYLEDGGRPWYGISDAFRKSASNQFRSFVRRKIKQFNKK